MVNWTNFTDFAQLPQLANEATGGSWWVAMLHMLWIILMMLISFWGFEIALLVGTFLCLILSFVFAYAGLISWAVVVEFAGIILFMFIYVSWSGRKN